MSKLEKLQAATTLSDVANILGFQPKYLAYILYKKAESKKYKQFEIPKRSGGKRLISAPCPALMNLQRRLSNLLQDCIVEINRARKIQSAISHGFRRKHSIITNAANHRNKCYVFNIDLENFFGTINFGRVRGFFITNRNFSLNPAVATVLAQIACHENELPQGSPCSPIISNLIGHLLDIRLASLAYKAGCFYSRYADDLTFSTNKPNFPDAIAKLADVDSNKWQVGMSLSQIIKKVGFTVNNSKTRMQYEESRQEVTGLVVNDKVNTRVEYRRTARAMVHRLLKTGSYQRKQAALDESGNLVEENIDGTLEQLNGILSFIDSVGVFNIKKKMTLSEVKKPLQCSGSLISSDEKVYQRFLFFKHFFASPKPIIVCEGKTDNIYIKAAIQKLADDFPLLAEKGDKGRVNLKVAFFRRTETTDRILKLNGGTDQLKNLIKKYLSESKRIVITKNAQPVILLIDNDSGAKDIFSYVQKLLKVSVDPKTANFIPIHKNFYIIPTPLTADGKDTMIEDLFEVSVRNMKLDGKVFNPANKEINHKKEYGKSYFASHVVKKNEAKIEFVGFIPFLKRIEEALVEHSKKAS